MTDAERADAAIERLLSKHAHQSFKDSFREVIRRLIADVREDSAKIADNLADRWDQSYTTLEATDRGSPDSLATMREAISGVRAIAAVLRALSSTEREK